MVLACTISAVLNAVICLWLTVFLWLKKSKYTSYILFNANLVLWSIAYAVEMSATSYAVAKPAVYISSFFVTFIPFFFFEFVLDIIAIKVQWPRWLNRIVGLIIAVLHFTPWMLSGVGPYLNFQFTPNYGPAWLALTVYFYVCVGGGHVLLFVKQTKNKKIPYLAVITLLGFIGGTTNFFLYYNFGPAPYGNFLIGLYATFLWYAIAKFEVMEIKTAITKTMTTLIINALVVASLLIPFLLIQNRYILCAVTVFISLLWISNYLKIRTLVQTPFHSKWISLFYNSDLLIRNITDQLSTIDSSKEKVSGVICSALLNTLKPEYAMFYKKHALQGMVKTPEYFELQRAVLINTHANEQLNTVGKSAAIIPLYSSDIFEGAIILGAKESEDPYTDKDFNVFQITQNQALIAIDRIRKHEEVIQANQALTAMNRDLEKIVAEKVKEAETAKAYAQKVSQQASFATLTKGVAHEIRNPLGMMLGSIDLFILNIKQSKPASELLEFAKTLRKNSKRLEAILETMLVFGKTDKVDTKEFDLSVVLTSTLEMMMSSIKDAGIAIKISAPDTFLMMGNPVLISQAVFNIVHNAMQAIEGDDKSTNKEIEVSVAPELFRYKSGEEKRSVCIRIRDTGPGIPEGERAHIFDAFHTTKYENTGLGLSLTLQVLHKHGGEIVLDSKPGVGSTFSLVFPLQPAPLPAPNSPF